MSIANYSRLTRTVLLGASILAGSAGAAFADLDDGKMDNEVTSPPLPSGQHIAPTAATGAYFTSLNPGLPDHPDYLAGQAIKTAVSPDGTTLLVLTSGYNNLNDSQGKFEAKASSEYVFVFDISGQNRGKPVQKQVIQIPNTFIGLLFSSDGSKFYASGGVDDLVHVFGQSSGKWAEQTTIPLGHNGKGNGQQQPPVVANLALSADGTKLIAANHYNDSISVIDLGNGNAVHELDLRPGIIDSAHSGVAGGESPFDVKVRGNDTVYVSSLRDREVVVVDIASGTPRVVTRIPQPGSPNSLILDGPQRRLFVAQDNTDTVAIIDTATNSVVEEIGTAAPDGLLANPEAFTGAAPNGLVLSPDENTLFVTNGGSNSVAVITLASGRPNRTIGLVPTGWYPHSVSLSLDGGYMYVVNGKSDAGPNPQHLNGSTARLKLNGKTPDQNAAAAAAANASNQYIFQLEHAGLLALPVPGRQDLPNLTRIVAANNHYRTSTDPTDEAVMGALRQRIRHVIYIVKENRTYDQVLGDLGNGSNGDPGLTVFGKTITPNLHAAAGNFVTLDNFFDSGEVSGNGWSWSTNARETDSNTKNIPLNYANDPTGKAGSRGGSYQSEGQDRNVSVGLATLADRQASDPRYPNDPNLLPGTNNPGSPDGPNGQKQQGFLWDSVLRAGLSVRNYGFSIDLSRYNSGDSAAIPDVLMPALANPPVQVAFPTNPTLNPLTDIYFRGFDNGFPDIFREQEWAREFDQYATTGDLPTLSLVRLMHDHMGNFGTAILGVNFPEAQQADNDYAVGLLIDRLAHSRYRNDTLIFVIEDDAQDGPDHVDAHRSIAFVVGPYVRHNAVVSTRYTTVNMLRTMEDVLGVDHLNLNDAYQRPMTDIFDLNQKSWTFHAVGSPVLNQTQVRRDLPEAIEFATNEPFRVIHQAAWWEDQTRGFDWSKEDRVPAVLFNQIVWDGLTGGKAYPTLRDGTDLRRDRGKLIRERSLHIGETE